MQNTLDLLIKALNYDHPEEIPIFVSVLPSAMRQNGDELKKIMRKYPAFFDEGLLSYNFDPENLPNSYRKGKYTDAWGCVWENEEEGMEGYVTGHPVPNRHDILTLKAPETDIGLPHGFMYLRLLDLRGFNEAMIDFAEECDELQILIDKVCDYNVRQMEITCETNPSPMIWVGDDLGMQRGLAIGAEKWRKYLKPAFKRIYDVCKEHGKYLYMHTDGDIIEIMPDIIETGVNIINPQFRANGLENLVKTCKGKIPINLDLDRQLFPFATPNDLRDHVREAIEKMYMPEGGLGINLEIGMEVPIRNFEAIIDELDKMRLYKG